MSDEKTHVVIKDGQRVSSIVSETDAHKQADAMRQKVNENTGHEGRPSKVEVKQNLFG